MATDKKITELDVAGTLTGAEAVPMAQSADTVHITLDVLMSFIRPFRGDYNASSNMFPVTGGSGPAGAIRKGDEFDISVAGTLGSEFCPAGTTIRARQDTPGQTLTNWRIFF